MSNNSLLARYEAGEFETVWQEIRSHRQIEESLREEVLEVANATMQRVAFNADLIADRLRERGWHACMAEFRDLRTQPTEDDQKIFAKIEAMSGAPIPPTLLAFWTVVGGINWTWDYRIKRAPPHLGTLLPMDEMDPLCVEPPSVMPHLLPEWGGGDREREVVLNPDESFPIDLAPDYLHKANVSGGPPYAVLVPFAGADPILTNEKHELPFVEYLRLAFKWAGFPGLEDYANRADVQLFIKDFGRGLLPF